MSDSEWLRDVLKVAEAMNAAVIPADQRPRGFTGSGAIIEELFMHAHPTSTPEAFAAWFANHARSLGDGVYEVRLA